MTGKHEYEAAVLRAETQRARLVGDVSAFKARITPARLKSDVKAKARTAIADTKTRAKGTVRRHPVAVGVVGAGLMAWFFRRPIARLIGRLTRFQPEPAPPPPVEPAPPGVENTEQEALGLPAPDPVAPPAYDPPPPPAPVIAAPAAKPVPETRDEE